MSPTISVVTVVFNRVETVADAIRSVQAQSYPDVEHVIIDGGSTDGTLGVLEAESDSRTRLLSEPDDGIYDALNKGIGMATGAVVGVMHSDDTFAHPGVLAAVAEQFEQTDVDAVYGDLEYVAAHDPERVIRHWVAGKYSPTRLAQGWMPPHPTLYLRREVFEQWGRYDTSFSTAADYDAILRWFGRGGIRAAYLPEVMVRMRMGGESNASLGKILRKSREDYRALRENEVGGLAALFMKNFQKLPQYFSRSGN